MPPAPPPDPPSAPPGARLPPSAHRSCRSVTGPGSGSRATCPVPVGRIPSTCRPAMAASTMDPLHRTSASSSTGSGRKSLKPNQRVSSLRASWLFPAPAASAVGARACPAAGAPAVRPPGTGGPPRAASPSCPPPPTAMPVCRPVPSRRGTRPPPAAHACRNRLPSVVRGWPSALRRPGGGMRCGAPRTRRPQRRPRRPVSAWPASAMPSADRGQPCAALRAGRRRPPAPGGRRARGRSTAGAEALRPGSASRDGDRGSGGRPAD